MAKTVEFMGVRIEKNAFGTYITSMKWGEWPGEVYTFKTLTAAKVFVAERHGEGRINAKGWLDGLDPNGLPSDLAWEAA